ncbi:formate dehydrogenase accessory sulfurtransferase FdhD [Frigidibacter sp. MR17.14]|uniref:formate dehydrogenase accessory sulfurtransferase FdhD n=1 Tax=Frigidibacter sp. MR17.14 TaxID=3126509 RepID=UPI003012EF1C
MTAVRPARAHREGRWGAVDRPLAEERPVAITVNGSTVAVMMATPADLEDFALGFLRTEGIAAPDEVTSVEILPEGRGIEARVWLVEPAADRVARRRRDRAGPVGCGLCGIDSLAEALRPLPAVAAGQTFSTAQILAAVAALPQAQPLHDATRAVHAAGFWREGHPILAREDVGRHNALDKLAGAMTRAGLDPAAGALVLTSRISVDMVQKAATLGAPVLIAASAPTTLAVAEAEAAGLTLVARARGQGFEVHTHPSRIAGATADV